MNDVLPKIADAKRPVVGSLPIIVGVVCRRIPNDALHIHDCTELWYALSGEAVHYVGAEQYTQTPGTCIALPSFVPHEISTIDSEDTPVFLCVNVFDNTLRKRGYDYFSYLDKRIYFEGKLLPIYHQFSGDDLEAANDIAHELSTEFSKHKNLNFNKLLDLYVSFLRLLGGEEVSRKITPYVIERTETILTASDYIFKHHDEKITLEKLFKLTNMSRSGFSDHFTRITGVSPMYYLKCMRMTTAQREF
ncbi:MAG: cupin domain-containing protein, partial [Oscillospiraceae bacterium]|nr:cupin domain-containing protein [Oscillospiraceae bacterium]